MIAGLTQRMTELGATDPEGAAAKAFQGMIAKQATVLAFGDGFLLLAAAAALAAVAALFARPAKFTALPMDAH